MENRQQDKIDRSFTPAAQHRLPNQTEPSVDQPTQLNPPARVKAVQTRPRACDELKRRNQAFFSRGTVAPWHRGFHEGVDWLSAVPHAPRREPGSISGEKVSVSSTDISEYPREDNGESLPLDTRPLGNWASCMQEMMS